MFINRGWSCFTRTGNAEMGQVCYVVYSDFEYTSVESGWAQKSQPSTCKEWRTFLNLRETITKITRVKTSSQVTQSIEPESAIKYGQMWRIHSYANMQPGPPPSISSPVIYSTYAQTRAKGVAYSIITGNLQVTVSYQRFGVGQRKFYKSTKNWKP